VRLETVRAQAEAVGARVRAAVRRRLRTTPISRRRLGGTGRVLRGPRAEAGAQPLVALAARARAGLVVVLAVAIGAAIVSTRGGGRLSLNGSVSSEASKSAPMATGSQDGAAPAPGSMTTPVVLSLISETVRHVVVARARKAVGGFQQFAVLRDLKGVAPDLLRLRVGAARPTPESCTCCCSIR